MDRVISIFCALVGAFFLYEGWFTYKFWVNKGPGGGFLPVLLGAMTLVLSIVSLMKSNKNESIKLRLKSFVPAAAVVCGIISIYILGLIVSVFVLVFIWLKFLEKYTYKRAGIIGICGVAFVYAVFKLWLQVPYPKGFIGV